MRTLIRCDKQLFESVDWDYFVLMEVGTDRLHHVFGNLCHKPSETEVNWIKHLHGGIKYIMRDFFLNVKGCEPFELATMEDYEQVKDQIAEKIMEGRGPHGRTMGRRAHKQDYIQEQ